MIVISGALVLVALVLLVLGLVTTHLPFVYASIAVSLVSFVFLVVGILQRRGEALPAEAGGPSGLPAARPPGPDVEGLTAVIPGPAPRAPGPPVAVPVAEAPAVEADDAPVPQAGRVLIVAGRPRYHVAGCRYLVGKTPDQVDAATARAEGFTPCGVCRPDQVLATGPVPEPATEVQPAEPAAEPAAQPAPEPAAEPAVEPVGRPARTRVAAGPAAAARRGGRVVVIPDRGRFHRPECRFVRDAPGATELTRTQAARQGYAPCAVCKP